MWFGDIHGTEPYLEPDTAALRWVLEALDVEPSIFELCPAKPQGLIPAVLRAKT
jgi:hypothetical protein